MRFFKSGFLHESIVPSSLSNILKYFRFHVDIHKNIFDFQQYPEVFELLGIVTQKFENVWVTRPGDFLISGYSYPEIAMNKTFSVNISAKTRKFSNKIWGVTLEPRDN